MNKADLAAQCLGKSRKDLCNVLIVNSLKIIILREERRIYKSFGEEEPFGKYWQAKKETADMRRISGNITGNKHSLRKKEKSLRNETKCLDKRLCISQNASGLLCLSKVTIQSVWKSVYFTMFCLPVQNNYTLRKVLIIKHANLGH